MNQRSATRAIFEQLEPRVLLSGSPMPVDETAAIVVNIDAEVQADTPEQLVTEILFVDTSVNNYQTLIENLKRNVEVVLIGADENGLDRISTYLDGRQDITAIHIISHGAAGEINLGNTKLNAANLGNHQAQLSHWGNALTEDADILIYGCDVGQDAAFVSSIATFTGADVAASDDLTGDEAAGGDAELELHNGSIEVNVLLDQEHYNNAEVTLASGISFEAISGDADSGIDSNKSYSHAIDFGNNATRPTATINGVVFANGGTGAFPGTGGGASQTIGTGSSTILSTHDGNDTADPYLIDGGLEDLVGDMLFNTASAEITLSGLTGGQTYQFKLYHRNYSSSAATRSQDITFDTDGVAGAEHSASFDEDDATLLDPALGTSNQVNALTYDYTLAAGQTTLTINIDMIAGGTYHLYGLTNEKISGAPNFTSVDQALDLSKKLSATFDENIQKGSGNIIVYNAADNSVVDTIDINSANVSISANKLTLSSISNLMPVSNYYIQIDAGAIENINGTDFGGIADTTSWQFSVKVSYEAISGDADSGIDSNKTYTHAIDFGDNTTRPTATINGVIFANGGTGGFPGTGGGVSQTIGTGSSTIPNTHPGNDAAAPYLIDGGMEDLVGDLLYNDTTAEITLTGLTGGQTYQFKLYHRVWGGSAGVREQDISFDTDGIAGAEHSASFSEDDARQLDPSFATFSQVYALTYDYTLAVGQTTLTINIDAATASTYHLYGLTNELTGGAPNFSSGEQVLDSNRKLVATFDKNIQKGSGNVVVYNVADNSVVDTIDINSADVSISHNKLTLNSINNLLVGGSYYVQIDAGAIENLVGTDFSGIADTTSWKFSYLPLSVVNSASLLLPGSGSNLVNVPKVISFDAGEASKLVVTVSGESSGGTVNITYNGVSFTQATSRSDRALGVWYLDNPYTGGAANLVIDMTSFTVVNGIGVGIVSIAGAAAGYAGNAVSSTETADIVAAQANSFVIVGYAKNDGSSVTTDSDLTEIYNGDIGSAIGSAGYRVVTAEGTKSYSFTSSDQLNAATVAAVFAPDTNAIPTLSSFVGAVDTANVNTQVEVSLADLLAQGDEADTDGTVNAFIVQAVSSGTLLIGTDAGSATAFATHSNDKINSTLKAYWTPDANVIGNGLNAFTVLAQDDYGDDSASAVQVTIDVIPLVEPVVVEEPTVIPTEYVAEIAPSVSKDSVVVESLLTQSYSVNSQPETPQYFREITFDALHFETENMDNPQPQPIPLAGQDLPSPVSSDTYDVPLLDPDLQKFLEDGDLEKIGLEIKVSEEAEKSAEGTDPLKDVPVQKEGGEVEVVPSEDPDDPDDPDEEDEEDEGFFDATSLDLKASVLQEDKALTQYDLDNLRSLDEQLLGEFDCLA